MTLILLTQLNHLLWFEFMAKHPILDWNLPSEKVFPNFRKSALNNIPRIYIVLLAAARGHEISLKRLKNLLEGAIKIVEEPRGQAKKIDYKNTALKLAAECGQVKILRMLIQLPGINWDIENEEGDTALQLILRNEELSRCDSISSIIAWVYVSQMWKQ